jgi:hypothetical protein
MVTGQRLCIVDQQKIDDETDTAIIKVGCSVLREGQRSAAGGNDRDQPEAARYAERSGRPIH